MFYPTLASRVAAAVAMHTTGAAPARGGVVLMRLPDEYVDRYLAGRAPDARVTYCTWRNAGRKYPYASDRQNKRLTRRRFVFAEAAE